MDVWEYFETKKRELSDAGLDLESEAFIAEAGSDGQVGRIWGRVDLTERTFLHVSERVEVQGSGIRRTEFAYYLVIDGAEIWGKERDPTHDVAEHQHDRDHASSPCDPISFKDAIALAWETASQEDSWEPPPDDSA